ncbi:hypothetical protein EDD98_7559 [Streptomyces sp. PanSC19]|uniref:DUF6083 domain-containing protein n=1 Tax=Streptomyces sp. PanSC19 TaxID=1520455 RepID=UPI000F46E61B|nr:DUF6083 domain-containing protein [Streptomyces sp. PanSC19]ROQ23609.1 hypothetical protein EDD98_7559 [Streptomyces sp. PanSC19]
MRSTHTAGRHWDGAPITPRRRRTLTVAHDSPSRLLRIAQPSHCRACGNRIDWHTTSGCHPIALHPTEVPAGLVPAEHRWHLASGIAHPSGDGSPWCRLSHLTLCPTRADTGTLPPALDDIRRRLALHTRRLTDAGILTPAQCRPQAEPHHDDPCTPPRPVVQLLYGRYIAAAPVEGLQCVAQTVRRTRCTHPVLAPGTTPGRWTLMPATPHRRSPRQPALPASDFAVYDLAHLTFSEQVRWRTQRCPTHAATPTAPDLALADWELFDPLLHRQFLTTRLPQDPRRRR